MIVPTDRNTTLGKIESHAEKIVSLAAELQIRAVIDEEAKELLRKIWQVVWCERCYDANSKKSYDTADLIFEHVERLMDKYQLKQ